MKMLGKIVTPLLLLLASGSVAAHGESGQIGGGFGLNYGIAGASLDLSITENISLTSGLGYVFDDVSYALGAKFYFRGQEAMWRPRITFLYGTTYVVEKSTFSSDSEYELFQGTSIGLGQSFAFGKNRSQGFDLDIFYRLTDGGAEDRITELEGQGYYNEGSGYRDITFSTGYRYNF